MHFSSRQRCEDAQFLTSVIVFISLHYHYDMVYMTAMASTWYLLYTEQTKNDPEELCPQSIFG